MFGTLLIGLGLFGLFTAFILPWIVFCSQNQLEKKLNHLLRNQNLNSDSSPYDSYTTPKSSMPNNLEDIKQDTPQTDFPSEETKLLSVIDNSKEEEKEHINPKATNISFEEQFGKKLPVWGGGIALALSVFFLVKYSIDNNLLSPFVRVLLGSMFGFGLLYVSQIMRQKESFANGQRIAQSLAGAGIIALYVVIFVAAKLYDMTPLLLAFVLMGGVTATTLVLSLRHGMPIAIMGLIGGFLTPVFLGGGGHNTAFLFGYLYLMIVGVHYLVKQSQQWWLSVLATGFGLLWVCVWLTLYRHGDGLWLGLFLIGLCIINVINSKKHFINNTEQSFCLKNILKPVSLLNYLSLVISMIIMGFIVNISGFGILEWGLLSLLALGTIGLAYFDERLYGFAPWISWGTIFVLLLSISVHNPVNYFLTVLGFGLIYALSSAVLVFKAQKPVSWACLCGINTIIFYLLAFFKTKYFNLFPHIPLAWGFLAFFLSIASVYMLSQIKEKLYDNPYKQYLYAVFATVATSFITFGLYIELPYEVLSVAVATQMLAIAWINQKVTIQALEKLIAVLAIVFGLILLPQLLLMVQLTLYSLTEAQLHLQASLPLVTYPLFQLGVPAIMFLGTSYLLEPKIQNPRLIKIFDLVAIGLIAIMGYYLTRTLLNPNTNVLFVKAGFLERGIITNVLFLYGLLCLYTGRFYNRTTFSWGGIILISAGLFRITYFDILIYNPLWASQQIKGGSVFNTLLLTYGLPILWTYFAQKELVLLNKQEWIRYLDAFKLVILFILLNLNVRYFFHGEFLNTGFCQNSEIYTYSVLWLLFGGGLLYTGTLWQDKALRVSSLGVILLAVTKVFLYDVSELDGLYRVFSFLGLGICLMSLSYFYSRYVFVDNQKYDCKKP